MTHLGHIKGEGRVFRAIVYNKGAMVLHMLRRLVGDEAFFNGLREFYTTWRYKKAGTEDFRVAMEHASGRPLEPGNLLHYVYAVPMSGGPVWLYTDPYHITAKAPGAVQQPRESSAIALG